MNMPQNKYPDLSDITSPNVDTEQAAFYLNRKPGTLRKWAHFENGPIKPIRINGRLAWPVSGLRRVSAGEKAA
ncbi:hypothetical protein A1342_00100 [Methylomonas methanica]|uniref:DNA-binding protein n=2 Tax=Methylomonas TaxID=416 RepID=A0A140E4Q4_9GAMM|nr:hypothetical protein JT25_002555 [Methylomonas denitrificans]OAI08738.1 hypothetical protein A1342_00100 [Methylomonas methanica]